MERPRLFETHGHHFHRVFCHFVAHPTGRRSRTRSDNKSLPKIIPGWLDFRTPKTGLLKLTNNKSPPNYQ